MLRNYYETDYIHTLRDLLERSEKKYGLDFAYKELDPERNLHSYTFVQLREDVDALGTSLLERGLLGKHFAIVGESSYSYVVSYMAVSMGLGVIVPLDKELSKEELLKLICKSDAEVLLYSELLSDDVEELKGSCPEVRTFINISMYGTKMGSISILDLLQEGRSLINSGDRRYKTLPIDRNKMAAILFTSGTTGVNKGVILSHKNILTVIHSAFSMFRFSKVSFSVLPINHTYEFNLHVLGCLYGGITLCFNDSIKHVKDNLMIFQPGMTLMVPMIVESLYKNIWKEAEKNNLTKHLQYGIWFSNLIRKVGIDQRKLFFKPIMESLGGNLQTIVCGGAPLRPDIVKGFEDIGISVYNGYGITECAPLIATNCTMKNIAGSVGFVIPDNLVRIVDTDEDGIGEIQVQGDNVMMGYYKDPVSTRKTFTADGWFKTGDLGYLDRKGALYITGREKNLIILANGKNVHPEELEEYILDHLAYVKEVVVYAPLSPERNEVMIMAEAYVEDQFLIEKGVDEVKKILKEDISKLNHKLSVYKRIHDVELRECEFEKTSTKKIKRYCIEREALSHVKYHH
ncbi:AMP-binding protein [Proteiniclasticum ruminis]|uniref:Long-chain acyl-CoA synthetase n=1 Tax=Proteiniclasticum ruminis TaxID=398199 RepID=A0A1G8NTZ1_9CLOT|nr:AMP-binding protein [Proteiniclasticum ruminis]SDI83657.1 long-chain acyl-CoA synthetase [Proteiniclasticum ruminis]